MSRVSIKDAIAKNMIVVVIAGLIRCQMTFNNSFTYVGLNLESLNTCAGALVLEVV